ncbi:hypothetical protein [Streptomyces sp. NRRL F-5630]|uniref:hypothetical protein n=1 Tax=Streptomyces sp. NRRL F-5630 TaxID=1463864 RepID=UPI003D73D336
MLIGELVDSFNDSAIGPEWGDSYGGVMETGGRARIPCLPGGYAGFQTANAWTLAGSAVFVRLATRPAASTAAEAYTAFQVKSSTEGVSVGFTYNAIASTLRLFSNVDYWDAAATELTYSAIDHAWLRIREADGTLYWETAPDGTTWATRRTLATPAWIAAADDTVAVDMFAYRDAGDPDYAEYDQVNTLSNGATIEAAATLTATSTLTAAPVRTVVARAALTAESALTAAPRGTVTASATLTATSTLTAHPGGGPIPEEVAGMAAGDYDLLIEQGATCVRSWASANDDGSPFSWDGWAPRAQIRTAASEGADLLLDLTPYLAADGPTITLTIPASVTETLHQSGRWDLELQQGDVVVRLLQGRAQLSKEVTQ